MENNLQPTLGNGKICYVELPAINEESSASFYKDVFNWHIRKRGDGSIAFDDGVGQVSGSFIAGKKAATEPGYLIHIMVDDIETTMRLIVEKGGKIVQPVGMQAPEITAQFSDPAGNVLGLYQEPTQST
jgi:predicted enzyme related to lactoylglutathione lyase